MTVSLRSARPDECETLSSLCLRSKGYWGHDAAFLDQCREELTIRPEDCTDPLLVVAEQADRPVGLARVGPLGADTDLLLFFVDPEHIGKGIGRLLWTWVTAAARDMGATRLMIEADPDATPIYEHFGATRVGTAPSASIPGRALPLLAYAL